MREGLSISVVIPVWRDEEPLADVLACLAGASDVEVIVSVPLGEESRYRSLMQQHPPVQWVPAPRGRAAQMNAGAALSRGRWLLFLHADCHLPPNWIDVIAEADRSPDIVAGAFRLAFDSRDWRARLIERGVRLRVALFRLPYGDQALFVRRQTFETMRGYRDVPIMEDVDFVRRVKTCGRLLNSPSVVVTSARRWERDGWFRRTANNVSLATRFLLGASPARLAQRYFDRKQAAIVMMARAPWTGGKTRLDVAIDETAHAELRYALFLDTLDVVTSDPGVEHVIACEPADACEQMRELLGTIVDVIPQRGGDLGQRMAHAFEDVARLGVETIVLVGSDLPDLPAGLIDQAFDALRGHRDRIVVGPSSDGGYYLLGMNTLYPSLFDGVEWSTNRVFERTVQIARTLGVEVVVLDRWSDIDSRTDLNRLYAASSGGTRTREWLHSRRC